MSTFVLNPRTSALWEYENYLFNSFAEFAGMYLGAGGDGVFQIDTGDLDDSTQITAGFAFGKLAISGDNLSRVENAFVSGHLSGTMALTVDTDVGQSATYTVVPNQTDSLQPCRVKLGKGLRGKYYQFALSNESGADFKIDSVTIDVAGTTRRV